MRNFMNWQMIFTFILQRKTAFFSNATCKKRRRGGSLV
jgi:hypothetical protein